MKDEKLGLVFEYSNLVALARQINLMLSGQTMAFSQAAATRSVTAEFGTTWAVEEPVTPLRDPSLGVWPTTEVIERPKTDSKGRLTTSRTWYLVLTNSTGRPVRNVRYRYEAEAGGESSFDHRSDEGRQVIAVMPPGATQRFPIFASLGSAPSAMCIVTWEDDSGEHETRATVMR